MTDVTYCGIEYEAGRVCRRDRGHGGQHSQVRWNADENTRLADLEALREVTERLVVARDPWVRHHWSKEAETILKRLREDEPAKPTTFRDIEEGRATSLREAT